MSGSTMRCKYAFLKNLIILCLSYALFQHDKLRRTKLEYIENSVYATRITTANGSVVIPLLHPFVSFRQLFLIAPKFNIVTCIIEKVMSGFRAALFCYLNYPKTFELDNLTLSAAGWLAPSCSDKNFTLWSWQAVLTYTTHNPIVFLIIRHPFQRFVSSYVDKCIIDKRCGCERDLLCFLKRIRSLLYSLHPDNDVNQSPSKRFLDKLPSEGYIIKHFAPLTWYCRSQKFLNSMHVIRLDMLRRDEMADAYDRLLSVANVPEQQRSYVRAEILKYFRQPEGGRLTLKKDGRPTGIIRRTYKKLGNAACTVCRACSSVYSRDSRNAYEQLRFPPRRHDYICSDKMTWPV